MPQLQNRLGTDWPGNRSAEKGLGIPAASQMCTLAARKAKSIPELLSQQIEGSDYPLYSVLVRLHLEYCLQSCAHPPYRKDMDNLKQAQ